MVSYSLDDIRRFLADHQLDFISDIVPSEKEGLYVFFIPMSRISKNSSTTRTATKTKIGRVISQIKERFGVEIQPVYVGDVSSGLEAGIRAAIELNFPGLICDCLVALQDSHHADVWLVPSTDDTRMPGTIEGIVADNLRVARVNLRRFHWGRTSTREPSDVVLLTQMKIHAPVAAEVLHEVLVSLNFRVPSSKWLDASLDRLRKAGFIRRLPTARYVLTLDGLTVVPHGRSRESSDIKRILALRSRKWVE